MRLYKFFLFLSFVFICGLSLYSLIGTYNSFAALPTLPNAATFYLFPFVIGLDIGYAYWIYKVSHKRNAWIGFLSWLVFLIVFVCTQIFLTDTNLSLFQALLRVVPIYLTTLFLGIVYGRYM